MLFPSTRSHPACAQWQSVRTSLFPPSSITRELPTPRRRRCADDGGTLSNRCLVPFNSFAEYAPQPNPETKKKDVVWFALADDRASGCLRGHLDYVQGRSRHQVEADPRPTSGLRLPDDVAERGRRADPSE